MLGFGTMGQFAVGQSAVDAVIAAQFLLDDADTPERKRRRKKQQADAFEEIHAKREQLRGSIYDAIHPPTTLTPLQFDPGLFSQPSPIVLPTDQIVGSILSARMAEQQRQQMIADMEEENDIEMLLKGGL